MQALLLIACDIIIAAVSACGKGMLTVQYAMLKRYHYLVQLAEQRHKLPNAQLFRIGADRTACDTVIASSLMGLTHKIHLERCGILLFLFGRVPFYVFYDVLFIFCLALFRVKIGLSEIPLI